MPYSDAGLPQYQPIEPVLIIQGLESQIIKYKVKKYLDTLRGSDIGTLAKYAKALGKKVKLEIQ